MPTYDYVCSNCGHTVEVMHGVHAHGPSTCPKCGGQMRKAFAPPAVHFRGTGWARKERSIAGRPKKSEKSETSEPGSAEPKDAPKPEAPKDAD